MDHIQKKIMVFDDIIPVGNQLAVATLLNGSIWKYGWRSDINNDRFAYWNAAFAGGDGSSRRNCELELMEKTELRPIQLLWEALKTGPLAGHEPLRIYANSHTYGIEGSVHTDNEDTENYFSTVYYAHRAWNRNWSGETVFYARDGQKILSCVYPKPGRVITFPGWIPHKANAPSRECPEVRMTVVFKSQMGGR
jgi:SM-20-related protein